MKKLKQMLKSEKSESKTDSIPNSTTSSTQPQTSQQVLSNEPAKAAKGVLMTTNYGDITIALYSDETPKVLTLSPPYAMATKHIVHR